MTKEDVFEIVKNCVTEILPDIPVDKIKIEISLKDLGANSIDRMDIVISAMEKLGLKIPLLEFGGLNNIGGLVNLLYEKKMGH